MARRAGLSDSFPPSEHVCLRCHFDRSLEYRVPRVGFRAQSCYLYGVRPAYRLITQIDLPSCSLRVCYPDRHDPSHHEPADRSQVRFFHKFHPAWNRIDTEPTSVITELIIGYALPGRPIAMMMFKTWGYITMAQALQFASDFKLGHYMKIAPRPMFWAQVVATVIAGTVQLGVQAWMFTNIPDICSPKQQNGFIVCDLPAIRRAAAVRARLTFVCSSARPPKCSEQRRLSGASSAPRASSPRAKSTSKFIESSRVGVLLTLRMNSGLIFFFLIGAVLPLVGWLISLRWPNSIIKYINFPVILSGTGAIPPASAVNYVPWTIVGFIFNYVIRRRNFAWWTKYNCESPACRVGSAPGGGERALTLLTRRAVRRPGRGGRHLGDCDLLLPAVPAAGYHRRAYHPGVVGQHRALRQRGRPRRQLLHARARGALWVSGALRGVSRALMPSSPLQAVDLVIVMGRICLLRSVV